MKLKDWNGFDVDLLDGKHASNFALSSHTHPYLPTSGGTISSANFGPFIIERSGSTNAASITFKNSSGVLGSIGMSGAINGNLQRWSSDTNSVFNILDSGNYKSIVTPANIGAAPASHTHAYLPTGGGSLTGRLTLPAAGMTFPTTGGSWISGKTATNVINVTNNSSGSYHPIIRYAMNNGNVANLGAINNQIGFWGFLSGTTENRTDAHAYLDVSNGYFYAKYFSGSFVGSLNGSVSGNANTATKLQTSRKIGNAIFDGSANIVLSEIMGRATTSTSNADGANKYTKIARVNVSGSPYSCCSGKLSVISEESNTVSGTLSYYFRTHATITTASINLYWTSLTNSNYASSIIASKVSDGVFDIYFKYVSSWEIIAFTNIDCSSPEMITFYSKQSLVSSVTVTATSTLNSASSSTTGNAGTATKLQTARTISLTGGITGSGSFDGSNNLSISTTLANTDSNATANKIVVRDSSGDVNCRLVRSNYANQANISGAIAFRFNNSTDNYIRFCSDPAAVRTWLGAAASSHTHSYLPLSGGTVTGNTTFNAAIYSKGSLINVDSKGVNYPMVRYDEANGWGIHGSSQCPAIIESNTQPCIKIGSSVTEIYHGGNKPSPKDIGASEQAYISGANLNDYHGSSGTYGVYNFTNGPKGTSADGRVAVLTVERYSNDWVIQTLTYIAERYVYRRRRHSGTTWGSWTEGFVNIGPETWENNYGLNVKTSTGSHYARIQASLTANEVLFGRASSPNADIAAPYLRITPANMAFNGNYVVSYGTNTNGHYIRFYDGTQICWKSIQFSKPCTSVWGGIYATGFFELGSWPAAFVDYPVTSTSATRGNNHSFFIGGHYLDTGTNVGSIELYRGTSAPVVEGWIHAIGIGRWK